MSKVRLPVLAICTPPPFQFLDQDPTHNLLYSTVKNILLVYMFIVLLYANVYNSNVWTKKYFLFQHCIGVSGVLVTPLSRLLSL